MASSGELHKQPLFLFCTSRPILRKSSGNGRCSTFASFRGARIDEMEQNPCGRVAECHAPAMELQMSRGMPSMTALLGLLALAGYQNRDKLAELLKGAGGASPPASGPSQPLKGLLGNLGGMLGGAGAGGLLNGGIGELLERFNQNGHGDTAQSWIKAGPNKDISPPQLKQ